MSTMPQKGLFSFANIFQSHEDMREPEVISFRKGTLPSWVEGTFLFTGAGVFDIGREFTVNNIADGYAVLGKFEIRDNEISFHKKILQSDAYKKALKAGKTVLPEYGTKSSADKSKGYFSVPKLWPDVSDNANHSVFKIGEEIFVSNGQTYFFCIEKNTLEIKQKFDTKKLFNLQSFGPHPYVDGKDEHIYNIGVEAGIATGARHVILKMAPKKRFFDNFEILTKVPNSKQPLFLSSATSFGITDNFLIVIESPAFLNLGKLASYLLTGSNYCLFDLAEWFPDFRNKFHIIDRHSGKVLKSNIRADRGFVYVHYINCYETLDGYIVIDMVTAPDIRPIHNTTLHNLRKDVPVAKTKEQGAIQRFRLPLEPVLNFNDLQIRNEPKEITLRPETISARGVAGVTFNHDYVNRKYRYCYGTGNITRGAYANSLMKFDLEDSKNHCVWTEEFCVFNEATFIANPEGHDEDDGFLICGVCSTRKDFSHFLLFLNAKDMTEVSRFPFSNTIPIYTHGLFIPSLK